MERLYRNVLLTTLISFSLVGCATREQARAPQDPLKVDAATYCEVYQPKHWQDVDPALGLYEQEAMVQEQLRELLLTEEFIDMMERLDEEVTHYRDLYDETRKAIEALTGEPWDCQAFANFYDIDYRRDTSNN